MASKTIKTDIYIKGLPPTNTGAPRGSMDYLKHYRLLITKALERVSCTEYSELHHILPKCLNGPDDPLNLVRLTGREHFVAHWLLHRAYPDNDGLAHAFAMMAKTDAHNKRYTPSSRAIAEAAEARAEAARRQMSKDVKVYDLQGEFVAQYPSAKAAAASVGSDGGTVANICNRAKHKGSTAKGFQFKWAEDPREMGPYDKSRPHNKEVIQYTKEGEFIHKWTSIREAEQTLKVHQVSAAANGKRKSAGGFVWKLAGSNKDFCGTQISNTTKGMKDQISFNHPLANTLSEANIDAYVV